MKFGKIKVLGGLLALLGVCVFSGVFTYRVVAGREPVAAAQTRPAQAPENKTTQKTGNKRDTGAPSTEPPGLPLAARLVGAREAYPLDLGGMTPEAFRKKIADAGAGPRRPGPAGRRFPASPKVDLKLELTNTGKETVKVQVRGNANKLTLDLKGPGAFYAPIVVQNFLPIRRPPQVLTVAPGQTVTITDVPTLAFPKPGTGSQAYWTTPGDYRLTVDYVLGVSPAPAGTRDVGDGFGEVIVHTAPITLKVVAPG